MSSSSSSSSLSNSGAQASSSSSSSSGTKFNKLKKRERVFEKRRTDRKLVYEKIDEEIKAGDVPKEDETNPEMKRRKTTMAQRRYSTHNDLVDTQKLLNDLRRKRTLLRASIPRVHRYFKHTDEEVVMDPHVETYKKGKMKNSIMKPKVEQHSKDHMQFINDQIEIEEDEEKKTDLEAYLAIFDSNYSFFYMKMVLALEKAKQMDEKIRKKEAESKKEKKNKITGFFKKAEGQFIEKVKRFYKDFYYSRIVHGFSQVPTPSLEETGLLDDKEEEEKKRKKEGKILLSRNDYICPSCEEETLFTDSTTKASVCHSCGMTFDSENMYTQSFAEAQASSVRNTAPYARISHVSIVFVIALILD